MNALAVDPSLTATGYANAMSCGVLRPPASVGKGVARLAWLRDELLSLARTAEVVVIEGYSFGSRGRQHATGELGGVLRLAFFEEGIQWVEIPPTSLKKYATGRGNAPKDQVLAAAVRRLRYQGHSHDEADALWLLEMARTHYGLPEATEVPKKHRKALEAIEWPELGSEEPQPTLFSEP